jgi:hypothetical protein
MQHAFHYCTYALRPLDYFLFLPRRGVYLRDVNASLGTFKTTGSRERACTLPDQAARVVGQRLIDAIGEPVELKLADQRTAKTLPVHPWKTSCTKRLGLRCVGLQAGSIASRC